MERGRLLCYSGMGLYPLRLGETTLICNLSLAHYANCISGFNLFKTIWGLCTPDIYRMPLSCGKVNIRQMGRIIADCVTAYEIYKTWSA